MLAARRFALPLAFALAALTGCSALTARVRGTVPLNPNEYGESTPVDLRFYQLRRAERFRAASVDQLWLAPEPTLATDRIGDPVEATVFPNAVGAEPATVDLGRRRSGAEFIGVLALFRHGDARDSRAVVLTADALDSTVLEVSGCSVAIAALPRPASGSASSKGAR